MNNPNPPAAAQTPANRGRAKALTIIALTFAAIAAGVLRVLPAVPALS